MLTPMLALLPPHGPPPWLALLLYAAGFIFVFMIGAIPFGWILVKIFKGQDLRQLGSGNIGATNAGRALGKWGALAVFALDFSKAFLPVSSIRWLGVDPQSFEAGVFMTLVGSAAILGHCFSPFLKFKGGKGVATLTGVLVAIDPTVFLIAGSVWIVTVALTKMVSLGSVLLGISLPFIFVFQNLEEAFEEGMPLTIFGIAVAILILYTHRENLQRIRQGTERKIGEKKT